MLYDGSGINHLSIEQSLYKVTQYSNYISYYKAIHVMVELTQLTWEEQVKKVLKNFPLKYKYPGKPATTDFLDKLYRDG